MNSMVGLTIWARPGRPARSLENVFLWQTFLPVGAPDSWVSLPQNVDRDRGTLRPRYQAWLASIAEQNIDDQPLPVRMTIRPTLSYWWMTLPTDNSLAVDSPAYSIIRLFALGDAVEGLGIDHINIFADRSEVAESIASWARQHCNQVNVEMAKSKNQGGMRARVRRQPWVSATRVFWNHLKISVNPRRKAGRAPLGEGISFVDYLAHLSEPGSGGRFRSNYWGPLTDVLETWPEPVNWLHVTANFATDAIVESDVTCTVGFNRAHPGHSVLHSYINVRTIVCALFVYFRLRRFGTSLKRAKHIFVEPQTGHNFTPLLKSLVDDQYFGRDAALNAFWICLWESALARWPHQRLGVYLFENQPWEAAFISAWRRYHHGRVLAVAHSTMLFWNLRYFGETDCGNRKTWGRPAANGIVVNGSLMYNAALAGGYARERLFSAEALRFSFADSKIGEPSADVLILGEYDPELDRALISMVQMWESSKSSTWTVIYRPHPASARDQVLIPSHWVLSDHPSIGSSLVECRVAVCGPNTSAALDARIQGRSVIVVANANAPTSSPAVGLAGVHLVNSYDDIAAIDDGSLLHPLPRLNPQPLHLDPDLKLWCQILSAQHQNGQAPQES